jgi:hypothetical protein
MNSSVALIGITLVLSSTLSFAQSEPDCPPTKPKGTKMSFWRSRLNSETHPKGHITKEPVLFWDKRGRLWTAPTGTITDWASIPEKVPGIPILIGEKDDCRWILASVMHDAYCGKDNTGGDSYHQATWQDTQWMFYEGCLAGGTPQVFTPITLMVGNILQKILFQKIINGNSEKKLDNV